MLVGNTSIMQAEAGNGPAKVIKEFRKNNSKPILKAAHIEESLYFGDENLSALADLKSKGKRQLRVLFVHNVEEARAAEEANIDMICTAHDAPQLKLCGLTFLCILAST